MSGVFVLLGAMSATATEPESRIQDQPKAATTVTEWMAQVEAAQVRVTGVRVEPDAGTVRVILETSAEVNAIPTRRSEGNTLVTELENAVLALPQGNRVAIDKPGEGIRAIEVIQSSPTTVQVRTIGEATVPVVEILPSATGLVLSAKVDEDAEEEEITVTGEGQRGYRVPNASTATKTDTPLRDIPQSIQVVPRQVLEDRNVQRVSEALRDVSGVQQPGSGGSSSQFDQVFIRGFPAANEAILRNGLRDRSNGFIPYDPANLEQIEVLKGPGSVLYGQGQPGGTVNLVTKQPLQEPFYKVEGTVGSYDFYRGAIDLTSPLNADKTVLYRLNAAVQSYGSFVDEASSRRYFVSPVLTWQISRNTKLTLEAEYLESPLIIEFGLPAVGTILPNRNGTLSRDRIANEPYEDTRRAFRIGYNLEHQFNENWQIRNAFRVAFIDTFGDFASGFSPSLLADQRTLTRDYTEYPSGRSSHRDIYALDTYVVGKFSTGSIQHQLVAGVDLYRDAGISDVSINRAIAPLDIFNPVFGLPPGRVLSRTPETATIRDNLGIYIQDQIKLAENLKVLLGGRFDIASQKFENSENSAANSFQQDEAFSPRVGIVYQPIPPISLYASYSRSFNQAIGTTFDNALFTPEKGTQYEVGIKADLTNKVAATLAFYNLTRSNVLTPDPRNTRFSIQTGEQRSRGIELDIAGELLPGWNVIASYAYTDATVTADNRFAIGNRLVNIPQHSASLWTTYSIQKGSLQGLGVGLGLYYVGDRSGDLDNTFELPNYLRTDAAIFYRRDKFRAALNFQNLLNVEYFESSQSRLRVYYGAPLTIKGSISVEF